MAKIALESRNSRVRKSIFVNLFKTVAKCSLFLWKKQYHTEKAVAVIPVPAQQKQITATKESSESIQLESCEYIQFDVLRDVIRRIR